MHAGLRRLGNRELIEQLKRIAVHERKATAALVAHLAEVERRGLHRDEGYGSAFAYCVKVLRLSEGGAYSRIYAARLVWRQVQRPRSTRTPVKRLSTVMHEEEKLLRAPAATWPAIQSRPFAAQKSP